MIFFSDDYNAYLLTDSLLKQKLEKIYGILTTLY